MTDILAKDDKHEHSEPSKPREPWSQPMLRRFVVSDAEATFGGSSDGGLTTS